MKKKDIIQLVKKVVKGGAYNDVTLTTQGAPRTRAVAPAGKDPYTGRVEYPYTVGAKTKNGMMEFKQPKSFDPDTIRLVREMLLAADIHHNELVGGYDEVSSYLDKRTGGTIIKFPHFNGPQGRGAMFGKETSDQIDSSKAKAKAAALKVYTQFKQYIEDFEISDASPAGVYGNMYLWVMFNESAKDYTAPKGGTQSSQFESIDEIKVDYDFSEKELVRIIKQLKRGASTEVDMIKAFEKSLGREITDKELFKEAPMFKTDVKQDMAPKDMAGRIKKVFDKVNGAKDPVRTPEWHKNRFEDKYGISFPKDLKGINKDQALAMNKYANDMTIREEEGSVTTNDAAEAEKLAKKGIDVKLTDMNEENNENIELTNDIGKDDYMDDEGRMAKSQLYKTGKYAAKLHDMLDDMEQLPSWIQSKLTKASDYMSAVYHYLDYELSRRDGNLMEHVDKYKKRAVLMEGAMKKFFEMFDMGKTDEEIIQDYAKRGTQVPEAFVGKARKQYEGLKKMKLELEMSEKEYKNSATQMVNNPNSAEEGMEMETKTLASGLTNEELDPVGKEDDDVNNDGKVDKTDKYLKNKRKAVSKAINKK